MDKEAKMLLDHVFTRYPLGKLKSFEELDSWANTNYKIKTTKGCYVVKVHRQYKEKDFLDELRLIDVVKSHNIEVTNYQKTNDGNFFSRHNDVFVSVKKWTNGKISERISEEIAMSVAKKLAKLHNVEIKERHYKSSWLNRDWIERTLNELSKVHGVTEFYRRLEKININEIYALPNSLVHGDVHLKNILVKGKNIILIDWEEIGIAPSILDLCIFISSIKDDNIRATAIESYKTVRSFCDFERLWFDDAYELSVIIQEVWFKKEGIA